MGIIWIGGIADNCFSILNEPDQTHNTFTSGTPATTGKSFFHHPGLIYRQFQTPERLQKGILSYGIVIKRQAGHMIKKSA